MGDDLDPVQICDSCIAWCVCLMPNSGSRAVPNTLTGFENL